MHIPDRARLGLGTLNLLTQIQSVEQASVDALVARAVAMYYHQHPHREKLENTAGGTHGQKNNQREIKR